VVELCPCQEARPRRAAEVDDLAERGRPVELEVPGILTRQLREHSRDETGVVDGSVGPGRDEERSQVGVRDDLAELVLLEAAVDRYGDRAELGGPEEREDVVQRIGHEYADRFPRPDSERTQRARVRVGLVGKLRVGGAGLREDERRMVAA